MTLPIIVVVVLIACAIGVLFAILSTGLIQSASGLGKDSVLTQIIKNFMERYGDSQAI